ncbi:MAG: hypothetical protein J2P36_25690, partial [Ktedonobacteraceae bacterium]|nr:hypothetical protein [Ktedonobacteraceae bacterium]
MYAKNHLETMRKYAQEKEARKVGAHYMYQALERWLEAVVLQRTPEATKPLIREIYHQVCLHTGYYQHIWGDIADELRYLEGEDLGLKIRVLLHQESYAQAYDEC